MPQNLNELLPTAKSLTERIALAEADEAQRMMQQKKEAEAEQRAFIEQLTKPSGVSDEEGLRRAAVMIERAVSKGRTSVQVHRFPNSLCTDKGRAINQGEKGWEQTLTGIPHEIYQLWSKYFRDRGYKLRAEIVDFSGGVPGDVALTLIWD